MRGEEGPIRRLAENNRYVPYENVRNIINEQRQQIVEDAPPQAAAVDAPANNHVQELMEILNPDMERPIIPAGADNDQGKNRESVTLFYSNYQAFFIS